jgi:peptide/nickel transport system permease protein
MRAMQNAVKQIARYPSAVVGLAIIGTMIGLAIYTVIAIPYSEAINLWRGGGGIWTETPRNVPPVWFNLSPWVNRPETVILDSRETGTKDVRPLSGETSEIEISLPFDYDGFPSEITLFFVPKYDSRAPHVSITWLTPDGREIPLTTMKANRPYRISLDRDLVRKLGGLPAAKGLFSDPAQEEPTFLSGRYELRIKGWLFEEDSDLDARLVVYGQVYGMAGTDHRRRDITVALMWGTPIALAFGMLAAVGGTLSTFILAAIGVWFGKWVDGLFRWLAQVNSVLPWLPILMMVGYLYSRSLWTMLAVIVALSVFSPSLFVSRAMFLQVKELSYIEAAKAYGAGNFRIIFRYMIPKVIPILIPTFVMMIPTMVFLEATLAILGLGDPILPTWGKVISDARVGGALFKGYYYWMVIPSVLLMMTGFGFAMIGFTLDRIFNPRLRGL